MQLLTSDIVTRKCVTEVISTTYHWFDSSGLSEFVESGESQETREGQPKRPPSQSELHRRQLSRCAAASIHIFILRLSAVWCRRPFFLQSLGDSTSPAA